MNDRVAESTPTTPERLKADAKKQAERLSAVLMRTARALQASADLAEQDAQRHARAGRDADAAKERRAAERAREAADRARSRAEAWSEIGAGSKR